LIITRMNECTWLAREYTYAPKEWHAKRMCAGGEGNIPHGERHFSSIEEKPNVTVTC